MGNDTQLSTNGKKEPIPQDSASIVRSDLDYDYYDDEYEGAENSCYACGGRGWFVDCIDDMCHGQDECIHGDDPSPCRACNPKGEREDAFL